MIEKTAFFSLFWFESIQIVLKKFPIYATMNPSSELLHELVITHLN